MILIIRETATPEQIEEMSLPYEGLTSVLDNKIEAWKYKILPYEKELIQLSDR